MFATQNPYSFLHILLYFNLLIFIDDICVVPVEGCDSEGVHVRSVPDGLFGDIHRLSHSACHR